MDTHGAVDSVRDVADHPVVERGAQLGYAAGGVIHLLIAWLGVQLVIGSGDANADQSGALGLLAGSTGGKALLGLMVAGFTLLSLWHLTEAHPGHEDQQPAQGGRQVSALRRAGLERRQLPARRRHVEREDVGRRHGADDE